MTAIAQHIANELSISLHQVESTIALLQQGASVPFIARYRKEKTGSLDDAQLRTLHARFTYLTQLHERRQVIINIISQQKKLTPELEKALLSTNSKTELEELYLPFKPKRNTKAQLAKDAGLSPLAEQLLTCPNTSLSDLAQPFIRHDTSFNDEISVLEGAKHILIERFGEQASLLQKFRHRFHKEGLLTSKVITSKAKQAQKFQDYFDHQELCHKAPSHRILAMLRARQESCIRLSIELPNDPNGETCITEMMSFFSITNNNNDVSLWLQETITQAWKQKVYPHVETSCIQQLKERAEQQAIEVFSNNLKDVLMKAPAGQHTTLGMDPGIRTGVKLAVVDSTGQVKTHATIFPHEPQKAWDKSKRTLTQLIKSHKVSLIALGNGTGSRETDKLITEIITELSDLSIQKVMVSEAGASIYSASEIASEELPNLDVSIRGAVSIARRLQDPLAELVKIDPKSIGVGQYQHDVNQAHLSQALDDVIEDCVNHVGVQLNTASPHLLRYVSGLNKSLAHNIVQYRNEHGSFSSRNELKKVHRLGPKAFELAAGFLRVSNDEQPLDNSGIHPETYPVVEQIAENLSLSISALFNNAKITELNPENFATETFGLPTIKDIFGELNKANHDPRGDFKTAKFNQDVHHINDLKPQMVLEGIVTNVANFGAFVDIGVHHEGLVHISALTNKFVDDPRNIVKAGDIVKVKVLEVDTDRQRINLSMRLDEQATATKPSTTLKKTKLQIAQKRSKPKPTSKPAHGAMADAFAQALSKTKK